MSEDSLPVRVIALATIKLIFEKSLQCSLTCDFSTNIYFFFNISKANIVEMYIHKLNSYLFVRFISFQTNKK